MVLLSVTGALHDLFVTKLPRGSQGWREHFSTAAFLSLSAHMSSPVSSGAAGALGSSNSTCPACSPGHPRAGGLSSLPTHGTAEVCKNNLAWCCLRTALISFVFSLLALCHFFPPKEKGLSYSFSCSSPEFLRFVQFFLMSSPAS